MDTWWSDEQVRSLRVGDVMPLPLMLETEWKAEGWEVNLILVTDVEPGGYSSVNPVWTHREPYGDRGQGSDEAERVTQAALVNLADRLRALLAGTMASLQVVEFLLCWSVVLIMPSERRVRLPPGADWVGW